MLSQLIIQNFAIIDFLELDFKPQMTAITGETGAGKSIAIDALGLVLGDRAEAAMVAHGCKRAEISASFDISKLQDVQTFLTEQEMDNDNECILRRTISAEGGSRAYINGRPVPLQVVKTLSEKLIDIHSQHQHQSLLRENTQRDLLDYYGQHQSLTQTIAAQYKHWHGLTQTMNKLKSSAKERASRIDFLQFQIDELLALAIQPNEWDALDQEQKKLANTETIQQVINESLDTLLNNETAVLSQLNHVSQQLTHISQYASDIAPISQMLDSGIININEVANDLRHQQTEDPFDSKHFDNIETRMASLLDIARKHRCEPGQLLETLEQLQKEIIPLLNAEENLDSLENEIKQAINAYQATAEKLSKSRQKTANRLNKACQKILKQLNMAQARLDIKIIPLEKNTFSQHGNEKISFQISTNPGSPPKPL
ncbi:MAG TPA: DNA repair protein RecN, partial [Gammaproteobacteria bacterium]|nr:DNA repair protein RecN [Gammaproteobacteria bacterium]